MNYSYPDIFQIQTFMWKMFLKMWCIFPFTVHSLIFLNSQGFRLITSNYYYFFIILSLSPSSILLFPIFTFLCRYSFSFWSLFPVSINPPFSWPLPQLEPSQIRLIVYQDCERRGRNVLFDSNAKKKGTEETPITVSHVYFVSVQRLSEAQRCFL